MLEFDMESKKKISLVLEGGGLRGAYTAGCLSWLIDEGIEFDGAYGISSGAVHLTAFLKKRKDWLQTMTVDYFCNKKYLGLSGLLKERSALAIRHLIKDLKKDIGYNVENFNTKTKAKIGIYDLNVGKTIYLPVEELNDDLIIAACSLPILQHRVKYNGHEYLDGGITDMIPIEQSVKDGYDAHLVITTKPKDYVRKKTNKFIIWLMKVVYPKCPNIFKDYAIRSENYYKQLDVIGDLYNNGKVFYRYPTRHTNVSRLGGKREDLIDLYNMGRQDMEDKREEIYKILK